MKQVPRAILFLSTIIVIMYHLVPIAECTDSTHIIIREDLRDFNELLSRVRAIDVALRPPGSVSPTFTGTIAKVRCLVNTVVLLDMLAMSVRNCRRSNHALVQMARSSQRAIPSPHVQETIRFSVAVKKVSSGPNVRTVPAQRLLPTQNIQFLELSNYERNDRTYKSSAFRYFG